MDANWNPMEGAAAVDMLSGRPLAEKREEEKAQAEGGRARRIQSELMLLNDLREAKGHAVFTRLLSDLFHEMQTLFTQDMDRDDTWKTVQLIRVRLQVCAETLGHNAGVIDQSIRQAIMGEFATMLRAEIPLETTQ